MDELKINLPRAKRWQDTVFKQYQKKNHLYNKLFSDKFYYFANSLFTTERITNLSVPQAETEFSSNAIKIADEISKLSMKNGEVRIGNNISYKVLKEKKDFIREGRLMHNCISRYDGDNENKIYISLREDDKPFLNLTISKKDKISIVECKRSSNRMLHHSDLEYLIEIINIFKVNYISSNAIISIPDDGLHKILSIIKEDKNESFNEHQEVNPIIYWSLIMFNVPLVSLSFIYIPLVKTSLSLFSMQIFYALQLLMIFTSVYFSIKKRRVYRSDFLFFASLFVNISIFSFLISLPHKIWETKIGEDSYIMVSSQVFKKKVNDNYMPISDTILLYKLWIQYNLSADTKEASENRESCQRVGEDFICPKLLGNGVSISPYEGNFLISFRMGDNYRGIVNSYPVQFVLEKEKMKL